MIKLQLIHIMAGPAADKSEVRRDSCEGSSEKKTKQKGITLSDPGLRAWSSIYLVGRGRMLAWTQYFEVHLGNIARLLFFLMSFLISKAKFLYRCAFVWERAEYI